MLSLTLFVDQFVQNNNKGPFELPAKWAKCLFTQISSYLLRWAGVSLWRSGIWDVWTLCRAAESRILGIWKKLNLESAPGDKKRPEPASGDKQGPGGDWSYLGWWLCLDTCSSFHSTSHRFSHLAFTMPNNIMPSFCLFMTQKSTLTHLTPSVILLRLVLCISGQSSYQVNTPTKGGSQKIKMEI